MIKKLFFLFDKRQKINLVILAIMILIGTAVECIGVTAIMPLVSIVTNPSVISTDKKFIILGEIFNISTEEQYIFAMSILLIIIYLEKNIYLIVEYDFQYIFVYNNQA